MAVLNLTIGRPDAGGRMLWRLADAPPSGGVTAHRDAERALLEAVDAASAATSLVFLIHGYGYDPNGAPGDPRRDPHLGVLRPRAAAPCAARRGAPLSWPRALGFVSEGGAAGQGGLAVAVGWSSMPARGRSSGRAFPWAYGAAAPAARAVHAMMRLAAAARPDLSFDFFAHSLGARVALLTLRAAAHDGLSARIGRILALGAAEYREQALRAARRCRRGGPEVFNFIERANDPYDALMQILGPRAALAPSARPLGAGGLGRRAPGWIDIQLDHPRLRGWLGRHGVAAAGAGGLCRHNGFYARTGIAALHRRILDEGWTVDDLRADGVADAIEPRWARFAPIRRRDLPTPRALADVQGRASIC